MPFNLFARADDMYSIAGKDPSGIPSLLGSSIFAVFAIAVIVLSIVAAWRVFKKAGKPGWAALVPIYNIYVLVQIAGRPAWWFVLLFVPIIDIVVALILCIDIGRKFGKNIIFSFILLFMFSLVGAMVIAFDDSRYDANA